MTYQPNIPTGTVDLDQDYLNIQGNFQQLDTQFGVDHIPFSDPTASIHGYHEDIHFNPISTTITNAPNNYIAATATPQGVPPTTPGFGQLFSAQVNDGINTDQSLYWISGGGRTIPLTRNLTPVSATNGYTCLPGGLILQWGTFTAVSTTATSQSFNINFPNACFGVWANMQKLTSQSSVDTVYCYGFNGAGPVSAFTYFSTSSGTRDINWVAVGN